MPPFAAIIFDNDGLLLDTEQAWTRAETILFRRYDREFTLEHKRSLLGSSHEIAAGKLERLLSRPGEGEELVEELDIIVMQEVEHDVPAMPGALELIARIRAAGVPLGLASNSRRPFVERALRAAGVSLDTFGAIRTGEEVVAPKPAPDVYLAVCSALGAAAAESAALEDSPPGVAAATSAGCFTIGVPSVEGMTLDGADLVAGSLADAEVADALGL